MRIPNSSAASSVANSKPTTPSLSEAATVSGMDSSRPGIKIVLRRAPLMAPTVASSDYEVVFCSTKSGTEGGETSNQ
uniref:Uncharacterized protein n=1 Tax=Panagrolaimus superbus TaxID=310955 RepID=A0A914Z4I0_9BILA